MKKIIQMNVIALRTPTGGRQTSWLFTSVAEELNSGLPRTTLAKYCSERDLNPGPPDFKSGALTTRPRCLPCLLEKSPETDCGLFFL